VEKLVAAQRGLGAVVFLVGLTGLVIATPSAEPR
jgi:hypothetical protein